VKLRLRPTNSPSLRGERAGGDGREIKSTIQVAAYEGG